MNSISRGAPTHSDRLERWLGAEHVARISEQMRRFYYPVAVHGVPGAVYAMPGGDFSGKIEGGEFASALDRADAVVARMRRARAATIARHRIANSMSLRERMDRRQHAFASLSAIVTAATTGGKQQNLIFQKTGVASNAIGNANDLWTRAGFPAAGAAGAAAAGGTAWNSASTGALTGYANGVSTDSNHFVSGWVTASVINNSLLLYDRLFSVAAGAALSGPTSTAVTGVPTRYQSATSTAAQYAGGNFLFPSNPTTVLAATGHNWAVGAAGPVGMVYTSQAGTTGQFMPVVTGVSACVVGGVDLAAGLWFMPLKAGDLGIKALTNMQSSAAVATGTIDMVIGHPIAIFPCPVANLVCPVDGINTAFNLTGVLDSACLSFLELPKPATTATTYSGQIQVVSE